MSFNVTNEKLKTLEFTKQPRPTPTDPNALLTEVEVATRQARSVRTLQNQRVLGGGIPFIKLGRAVRYRLGDVETWEENRRFSSTSEGRRPLK